MTFQLQRQRAWGWETLDDVGYYGNGSGALSYNCSGDGTYTYRTYGYFSNGVGVPITKYSSTSRFTC
ncbi:hypothetical protein [Micromonospora sp. NBS 11-29]|uniref:hypothetical protein n=1 Tax=Micromonospora sp. NBS 11-29 TaxID=1960879 RepID=UPI000B784B5A|nr:hypothetical protein [Micromonospora sp. NBS 11-29]